MTWMVLLPLLFTTALAVCPNGFVRHRQSCYTLVRTTANWPAANFYCHLAGAKLAEIESETENTFLNNWLKTQFDGRSVWIGGHDFVLEGEYHWATTRQRITQFWWADGEPNNWNEEDCLALWKKWSDFVWADGDCDNKSFFVCESEIDSYGHIHSDNF